MKAGWEVKPLGEIFEIGSSKRVIKSEWRDKGVPFYRAREIVKLAKNGYVDNDLFIEEDHFEHLVEKHGGPVAGDLMISAVGTLGICYEVKPSDRFYYKDASVLCFHPKVELDSRFVEYAFQTDQILEQVTAGEGATVGTFTIGRAKATLLNLPPLEEQKQIVAVLDAAFEGLTRAKENAEANLQNARELFEATLAIFFDSARDERLVEKQFDQVCVLQRGFDLPKRLRTNGEFDLVTSSGASDTHNEYKVEGPGVATGRSGSIGSVFFIEGNFWPLNTALYIKEFHGNLPKYIWYFLRSFDLGRFSSGAGVPTLNRNHVHGETAYVHRDIDAQMDVVEKLEELEKTVFELEVDFRAKLTYIADLRQSLLQKAFAGELT